MAEVSDEKWEKRARILMWPGTPDGYTDEIVAKAIADALQLGHEMADERAEEIAKAIEREVSTGCDPIEVHDQCVTVARSTISKPKTREQVLEEALERIVRFYEKPALEAAICEDPATTARNALRWKS